MNLKEFNEKYSQCKDVDLITVTCDHNEHKSGELKPMKAVSVRRNIMKHNDEMFVCRTCHMKYANPMNVKDKPNRKQLGMINVECPTCGKKREMKATCYFGLLEEPYKQECGSCVQEDKEISQEQRNKISTTLTGRKLSEEHVNNILKFRENNPEWAEKANKNLIPGMGGGWNTGKETPQEVKDKQSKALLGREKTLAHKFHISQGRKKMLLETGGFTREHREKLSKATIEQYKRGFDPNLFHLRGWHVSPKCMFLLRHKSSYEKRAFMLLDEDPSVVSYEYETISIEYYNPKKQINANYLTDLKVYFSDGKVSIVEIKPASWLDNEEVAAKLEAGLKWCQSQNMGFEVWHELHLYGPIETLKKVSEFTEWLRVYLCSEEYCALEEEVDYVSA